ncbi:site-specific integrase [Shimia abyssi]|uniref:Phage integrase family protein n=1 Tax=Shimia abyssi TaxID=1662395 RepID=A0A2P8ET72_9RHOB|nr:site-specific integrase [Shimia abyssi]PSL12638.1 phage integrase family protein [Shimia abyssi]
MQDLSTTVSPPTTLSEVLDRLSLNEDIAKHDAKEMASAVNAVARFSGLPTSSVVVNVTDLRRVLETVQPRRFKISSRRLGNIRSLFVRALALTGAPVEPLRLGASLSPAWADLMASLSSPNDRNALTRFSQWCSLRGIEPDAVVDAVLADYRDALINRSFVKNAEKLVQNLIRSWNRSVGAVSGWPKTELTVVSRRQMFMLPVETFPESFQKDLDAWCDRLAGSDLLDEQTFKPLRQVSVIWYRDHALRCASALVHDGWDPSKVSDLSILVQPDHVKIILRWFLARGNGKPSQQTHHVSGILLAIGRHWAQLDDAELDRLKAICSKCRVKSEGMTKKNRDTIRLFDDEVLVRELLYLPDQLMKRALITSQPSKRDAYLAAQALAIGLLLNSPIRIENLANINIDRHILRRGKGRSQSVSLCFPSDEVKNDLEIELPLAPETVRLLDSYLTKAWPILAAPGCRDLFPGKQGSKRSKVGLGMAIAKTTERELGVRISPHQFRHIAGYLFLKQRPGDYETVRVLLGHKSLQTTIQFYAGMEISAAAQRFDEVVLAPTRRGRRAHQ